MINFLIYINIKLCLKPWLFLDEMGRIQTGKNAETDYFASRSVNSAEMGYIQTGKTAETDYFASRSADPAEMGHMVAA